MLDNALSSAVPMTAAATERAAPNLVVKLDEHRDADVEIPVQHRDEIGRHLQAFGQRLRIMRRVRGWSLREFSHHSGMDRHNLSRIEAGKNITLTMLWRLANGLGVHWADLLDDRTNEHAEGHRPLDPIEQQLTAFGVRLYEIRVLQHVSQPELSTRTGVSRSIIDTIESGSGNIRLDTLMRLATGLGVHWANLLDERPTDSRRPDAQLREAIDKATRLRAELEQVRQQLTLAVARADIAKSVSEHTAARQITSAAEQTRLLVARYDGRLLAALDVRQLRAHLEGRRKFCDYLDLMWHNGQRDGLSQRPEWISIVALRELAQYLMSNALDEQMHRN